MNKAQAKQSEIEDEVDDMPENEVDVSYAEKPADDASVIWGGRNGKPNDDERLFVQVGDHVTYIDLSTSELKTQVQIVSGKDNLEAGIINETRPLAQTLLDMEEDEEVELSVPGRPIHKLKIVQIKKRPDVQ